MCCFLGTAGNDLGCVMPGRKTTTGTLPIRVVLEKERFGGSDRGAVGTLETDGYGPEVVETCLGAGFSPATVSWRSCVHCPSLASGFEVEFLEVYQQKITISRVCSE